jgi:hypothetical protein
MNEYRNFIGKQDLDILDNNFKILISILDLNGYDIWIYYPSNKKIEKDFKFVKSVGNLVFLTRQLTSLNGKDFTSNTIVEVGKVAIFYGNARKIIEVNTTSQPLITTQQKQRFMQSFIKNYKKT